MKTHQFFTKTTLSCAAALLLVTGCSKTKDMPSAALTPTEQSPIQQVNAVYNPVWGMSSQNISWAIWKTNDHDIAASRGQSTPFVPMRHSYNSDFPATWAASAAGEETGYGLHIDLINMKTDWGQLASGTLDTKIKSFINSIPAGVKVFLSFNHEPENNGPNQTQPSVADRVLWCKGQAEASRVVFANAPRSKCEYASCLMGYTFDSNSGRNPDDYNPGKYMTAAEKDNHIFGVDMYFNMPKTGPGPDVVVKAGPYMTTARSYGFSRLGFLEVGLDNVAGNTDAACGDWIRTKLGPWMWYSFHNVVFAAYFNATTDVNNFDPFLDSTPERQAFADLVMH